MSRIDNYKQTTYLHLCDNYVIIGKTFFQTFWKRNCSTQCELFWGHMGTQKDQNWKVSFCLPNGSSLENPKKIFFYFFKITNKCFSYQSLNNKWNEWIIITIAFNKIVNTDFLNFCPILKSLQSNNFVFWITTIFSFWNKRLIKWIIWNIL